MAHISYSPLLPVFSIVLATAQSSSVLSLEYIGRVHPVVHKYTTIFICICRLNTTFFNDIIGERFQS